MENERNYPERTAARRGRAFVAVELVTSGGLDRTDDERRDKTEGRRNSNSVRNEIAPCASPRQCFVDRIAGLGCRLDRVHLSSPLFRNFASSYVLLYSRWSL